MIGVASELCGIHPQTLRQYEKLGLVIPARVGAKNRLYSQEDIDRVKQIQRLTQELGVNLAGVEIILRLLDDMEEIRADLEEQMADYVRKVEQVVAEQYGTEGTPVRTEGSFLPIPKPEVKKPGKL
jgi:MerR family transcriptional regulator/heat shock protein HspR